MAVHLPRTARDLIPRGLQHAVRRSTVSPSGWLLAPAAVVVMYLGALLAGAPPVPFRDAVWLLLPFLALAAWARAAARVWSRARVAFGVLAAAPALGLTGWVLWAMAATAPAPLEVPAAASILLIPNLVVAAGAALTLGPRPTSRTGPAVAVDAALLLLAGAAATFRYVVEPLYRTVAAGPGELAVIALLQGAGIIPVFVAALVVLRHGSMLAPRAGALLLGATLCFAAASLLPAPAPAPASSPYDLVGWFGALWLGGWLLFALSGLDARRLASTTRGMLAGQRGHEQVRRLIVPGAALFLALAVLDLGLGPRPRPETVAAVAMLGMVLAVRTAHAFRLVDRDAAQRRQIAHTRALIDVTHSLAGTTDLDATLRVISESARDVFGTRAAGIELVTDDGRSLEMRSSVGLPEGVLGLRFPIEGSFTGWVVQHGEARATVDPTRDPYIQPQSLDFLGRWPVAAAPIRFRDKTLGALFTCIRGEPFGAEELVLLDAMAEQAAIAIQNARLFEQVTVLSITDPLTGLANRRQLERELTREFAAARRGRELVAVIFDMDLFKEYNDAHGHLAGDEAIQTLAAALKAETRAMNLAARYGGDEFVVLLSDTDREGAEYFIERVRERFDRDVRALGRGGISLTAGIAQFVPEMLSPDELLRKADDELYRLKPGART